MIQSDYCAADDTPGGDMASPSLHQVGKSAIVEERDVRPGDAQGKEIRLLV